MPPVERARPEDWPAISGLLSEVSLPLDGAREAFATGVIATAATHLAGCAAIEPFGSAALLRSVAVAPDHRGHGIGRELVAAAEGLARARGATDLYLLTETAEPWFGRLGYERVERSVVPDDVRASVEFEAACAATAVAMHRVLVQGGGG